MQDQIMEVIAEAGKIFSSTGLQVYRDLELVSILPSRYKCTSKVGHMQGEALQCWPGYRARKDEILLVDAEDMRVVFRRSKSRRQQGIVMAISRHFEANFSRRHDDGDDDETS